MLSRLYTDSRKTVKTDLLWFFGSSLIGLPIAYFPIHMLGEAVFCDRMKLA